LITLAELGLNGLRSALAEQARKEMAQDFGGTASDLPGVLPSARGKGYVLSRKGDAAARVAIDQERHRHLIVQEIYRLYETDDGKESVSRHARITRNVLKRTADTLAVAYERPPVRKFGADGSAEMARAWRATVLEEGMFNLRAEQWARYAFITNVVHVLPSVVDGRLHYTMVLPHAADVVFGPGDTEPSILVYLVDGGDYQRVAVDNERFWYITKDWKLAGEFRHGYIGVDGRPMQPWIPWRAHPRLDGYDYWTRGIGRQLVDATLKVGVVNAAMEAVRQRNNSKLSTLTANRIDEDVPPGQTVSPERPLLLRNKATFEVHDLIVPVESFLADIDGDISAIADAYNLPPAALDRSKAGDDFAIFTAVAKARERQEKHLRRADLETSIKSAIIMRADGHSATAALDPERVARSLELEYQRSTFMERPKDRFESYRAELSLGLASPVDLRMREHPSEDKATATTNAKDTIEERNEFNELLAERNMSADAGQDGENLAQLQGRLGGLARMGQAAPGPRTGDDDDDRAEQQQ
jgi:hypothetical protein